MYTLYMHISPSHKVYIGVTCQEPRCRWKNGKGYSANDYFSKAIKNMGGIASIISFFVMI